MTTEETEMADDELVEGLAEIAEHVARSAGELVLSRWRGSIGAVRTKSSEVDVVTEVDTAAEAHIRELLAHARPDDGILGEEGGHEPGSSGLTWVIDPIDGTVNFLYGLEYFSVSVAVVRGTPDPSAWTPLAGCVHAPALRHTWRAAAGRGATADGVPLAIGEVRPLGHALLATGFAYDSRRRGEQAAVLRDLLPAVRDIRRLGSAAVDMCLVAEQRVDVFFEQGLNPWDMAAGQLIVTEAGGTVQGFGGAAPGAAMTIAGPAQLVQEVEALIARA